MTDPAGTVALDCCVTVPTTRPAVVIAVEAAVCVRPTTFGTAICGRPDDTTIFTAVPGPTCAAAVGFWLITDPDGTVVLDCCVTVPTTRPAFVMAVVAAAWVSPTTFGTALTTSIVTLALALVNATLSVGVNCTDRVCPRPAGSTVPAGGV